MAATAKKRSTKACGCAESVNEQLKEFNTTLDRLLVMNFKTGDARSVMCVATAKRDSKNRMPMKRVVCTYCPFCGKKLPE